MMPQSPGSQRQDKARQYARLGRLLYMAELGIGVVFLLVLLLSPLSVDLRDLFDFALPLQVALYAVVLVVCYGAVTAPLSLYRGFVLPRRYGLLSQGLRGWLWDEAKAGALGLVMGVAALVLLYWLMAHFAQTWWLWAGLSLLLLTVVLTNLAPLVIVPLFYRLEPLGDATLGERLAGLARRAGTRVKGVFTIDMSSKGTTGNAALMGLGNTRRIVLGDTILDRYTTDEIETIVAHELGHQVHRDVPRLICFQSAVTLLGLYLVHLVLAQGVAWLGFGGIADIASFPLLALLLGAFALVVAPLESAYSRHLEGAADEYALALTDNPQGFVTMMTKLADQNLSEAKPPRWVELLFYDHPPYQKRLARAYGYAARREGER
ncbi:MAG: M48 family metalloprotease [Chloroflexota bacterium]|nr:M48 family metalloprotease [Chloroflexota bacterium]